MIGRDVYRFGPFTLALDERRLSTGNHTIRLPPKAFNLLAALVQHPGRLMTKHELLARVWPEVFVEEGILTVHVSALRKALGDKTRPSAYIETVSRSGYRFVAAVTHDLPEKDSPLIEPPRPLELYEFVGRGRVHLLSGSHAELPRAVDAFRAAIALDPTYAPPHAGLASARCKQATLRAVPHQEAFAEAKTSALRALALDSSSADAQVALGTVQFLVEWDWIGAERSLQRALQVSPDHTEGLLAYGWLHEALGRLDEGLRFKQRALARDPHSPVVLLHIALSCSYQGKFDEALAWANRALEIDRGQRLAATFVAFLYWSSGDIDRFIDHSISTAIARGIANDALAALKQVHVAMRHAYAEQGVAGWSQFMADHISNASLGPDAMSPMASQRAVLYAAAGRLDEAFACLDEAIAARDPIMVSLAVGTQWDPLRADRRFASRLQSMSLPAVER